MTGGQAARRATPWAELDIHPNAGLIAKMDADRERAASPLARLERWNVGELLRREISQQAPAMFDELMELWVGAAALDEVTEKRKEEYVDFLRRFGLDERFLAIVNDFAMDRGRMLECDLGPIQDYLILEAHLNNISTSEPLILLEVGGGYGRLAELFLRYSSLPISYLLVDGVPESVYYSWEYLRQRLPDHRIGIYFNHQHFDPARFDAYVLPAWRAKEVLSHPVHGAINVASIQEMPDETVAAYLDLFQQNVTEGGLLFLENSREFFYVREYLYPTNWLYLLKTNTPRSRSLDYPLDLLRVTREPCDAGNKKVVEEYYATLKAKALRSIKTQKALLRQERKLRKNDVSKLQRLCDYQSKVLVDLRAKNAEQNERLKALSVEVTDLKREKAASATEARRDKASSIAKATADLRAKNAEQNERINALLAGIVVIAEATGDLRAMNTEQTARMKELSAKAASLRRMTTLPKTPKKPESQPA